MKTVTRKAATAFTLIELLVVLGILTLLLAILLPVLSSAREKARQAACTSNMRQLGMALTEYAADNGQLWPPYNTQEQNIGVGGGQTIQLLPQVQELKACLSPYIASEAIWYCPNDSPPGVWENSVFLHNPSYISYEYMGRFFSQPHMLAMSHDPSIRLMFEPCRPDRSGPGGYSHNGRANTLYRDGHVEALPIDSHGNYAPTSS